MGQLIIRVQTFFERVAPKHEPLARADSLTHPSRLASATPADKKYGFTPAAPLRLSERAAGFRLHLAAPRRHKVARLSRHLQVHKVKV